MFYENILYEKKEGLGYVTVNRPKVLNALNSRTVAELTQVFTEIKDDSEVRVVILTGSGDKGFIAGADISEIHEFALQGPIKGRELFSLPGQRLLDLIENLGKPVIAAVNGYALGGGCEIIEAVTLAVASEKARMGQPEINLGFNPCWGGTQRLTRLVGRKKAMEMVLTGDMINAQEALQAGLVNMVVPQEQLMQAVEELARKIAKKSAVAVNLCLEAVNHGLGLPLDEALNLESNIFAKACATEDIKEGTTAFIEKRDAVFKDA
jgi:enoyl-CoA hydratase